MEAVSRSAPPESFRVTFEPGSLRAEVPAGTSILEAARAAGVLLDTPCGGEGFCGKCRVRVRSGKVDPGETELLDAEEVAAGWVLACRASVAGNLAVEVPPGSVERFRGAEVEPAAADAAAPSGPLDPLVRSVAVEVAAPTLEDNASDFARLARGLRKAGLDGAPRPRPEVLRELPGVLRASGGGVTVTVARDGAAVEVTDVAPAGAARGLALAVDVGTTTIKAELLDLATGRSLGRASKYNSQAAYGGDVIHRIIWCTERAGGLDELHGRVMEDIGVLVVRMEEALGVSREAIALVAAAGNTTMMHILLGLSPEHIRREPYVGVAYDPPPVAAGEIGLAVNPRARVYSLPCVSGFVGADIAAGLLAVRLEDSKRPRMLIDIGTNGEIVIGNRDWMVCASASAGPAFEGAGTRDGMRATRGAIDHVRGWDGEVPLDFTVLGDAPPCGLCGTAYVDLLAELLRAGAMDRTGSLNPSHPSGRVRSGPFETPEFVIVRAGERGAARDVVVTQHDIANLERAKGAIYAATKVLLKSLDLDVADLEEILVAGAFGNYLDVENCVFIGLLPDLGRGKIRFAGNTAAAGAAMAALDRASYARARELADGLTYFELSTDPSFMGEFTSACFFPHTNLEEFPSVKARLGPGGG